MNIVSDTGHEEWEEIRKCWEPDSNLRSLQTQAPLLSVSANTSMNMDLNIFSLFATFMDSVCVR